MSLTYLTMVNCSALPFSPQPSFSSLPVSPPITSPETVLEKSLPEPQTEPIKEPEVITHALEQVSSLTTNPDTLFEESLSEVRIEPIEKLEIIIHVSENDDQIIADDNPWKLIERSQAVTNQEAPALLIRAINAFIDRGQNLNAQSATDTLTNYPLTLEEKFALQIIHARLADASGEYVYAINLLSSLNYDRIQNIETKKQALTILANAQIALGHSSEAMTTLLDIELLNSNIPDNTEQLDHRQIDHRQIERQQKILQLLRTMDGLQVSLLRESLSSPDLDGWLALADTLETTTLPYIDVDLALWRLAYPDHPAQSQLIDQYAELGELDEYQKIALLLPLTSPYGAAASAFYDGFMQAHSNNISFNPPQVVLYDVGEDPYLSSFYYQVAVNEGADFIVGPLGRKAADALLSSQQPETTTLLIAEVPPESVADNLFGISLSPEKETQQIAEKAFADGHRQATVFRSQSEWGERVANAFASQWELLGGTIVKNESFPKDTSDYTQTIQKFFGLDKSLIRARLLEAQVGTKLKFTPRRNDDMDMLFLAANVEQSRLVVPQLRFFQAHNLPIYTTSYVYSGSPDPSLDADLDGLIFGDMKWMLEGVSRYKLKVAEKQALKEALLLPQNALKTTPGEAPTTVTGEPNTNEINFGQRNNDSLEAVGQVQDTISDLNNPEDQQQASANKTDDADQVSTLNRLYALGIHSYQLIPRLNLLRSRNLERFFGQAMAVSVDQDGSVVRHPIWAKFVAGLAEPLEH